MISVLVVGTGIAVGFALVAFGFAYEALRRAGKLEARLEWQESKTRKL